MHFLRGEYPQALQLAGEAHRHSLKTGGPRHPNTAVAAMQLALVKAHSGHPAAEQLARDTLALQ